jgi:hypothetical protein
MGSGVAWGDFDNDGFDDLFVVSGGGSLDLADSQLAPSVLYRNLGNGRFEKVKDFPELRIRGMGAYSHWTWYGHSDRPPGGSLASWAKRDVDESGRKPALGYYARRA